MIKTKTKSMLMAILTLTFFQIELAQGYPLTERQEELRERGRVKELARSLVRGAESRAEDVSRLYLFVRDEIEAFHFENRRAPRCVLRDGAGRKEDKARLLSELLDEVGVEGYLATINLVKFGEDYTYSFVAIRATEREAEAMSKATGGEGSFTRFPLRRRRGRFLPLVPLSGYSIGQLSPEFYEETEEGNGKWRKWKRRVRLARF